MAVANSDRQKEENNELEVPNDLMKRSFTVGKNTRASGMSPMEAKVLKTEEFDEIESPRKEQPIVESQIILEPKAVEQPIAEKKAIQEQKTNEKLQPNDALEKLAKTLEGTSLEKLIQKTAKKVI